MLRDQKLLYSREIKGLQTFAILAITVNHFNKNLLPSGLLGIDILFFIAGYLILNYLAEFSNKSFLDFISNFIEKAIKFILPSLILFISVTCILISLFHLNASGSIKTGILSLFGLSNIGFYLRNFPNHNFAKFSILNPFMHTWAIGVLIQFYFLLPFLLWFTGFTKKTTKGYKNLFSVFIIIFITSLISFIYLFFHDKSASYFLVPSRLWEISSGSLLFLFFNRKKTPPKLKIFSPTYIFLAIIGLMLLPVSLYFITTILIIVLSALLLFFSKKEKSFQMFFTNRYLLHLAKLSFQIYLWHWPIISISKWTIGVYWWSIPFQIMLIYGMALLANEFSKKFVIEDLSFKKKIRNIIIGFFSLLIGSLSLIQLIRLPAKTYMRAIGNRIFPAKYLTITGHENPLIKLYCFWPDKFNDAFKDCFSEGNIDKSFTNIYLTGDSHGLNHFWSMKSALEDLNFKTKLHKLSEPGIANALIGKDDCGTTNNCIENAWSKYLNFFKKNLNEDDLVIIGLDRDKTTKNDSSIYPRLKNLKNISSMDSRLRNLANLLIQKKSKLILIDDVPKVCEIGTFYTVDILIRGLLEKCIISEDISKEDRQGLTKIFRQISKEFKNVLYIDPHSEFCYEGLCSVLDVNGKIIYADDNSHLRSDQKEYLSGFWRFHFTKTLNNFKK